MSARGAIAQLGERLLCKQEVTGSIPVGSIGNRLLVLRAAGLQVLSKRGQYLDVISVAHSEDAGVERNQTYPAAAGKCQ